MNKICLIGSTRFREQYERLDRILSKMGYAVYTVSSFGHSGDELTADEKETLDLVHLRKIAESDLVVLVSDPDEDDEERAGGLRAWGEPYIGDSTRRELKWAKMLGKSVRPSRDLLSDERPTDDWQVLNGWPYIPEKPDE